MPIVLLVVLISVVGAAGFGLGRAYARGAEASAGGRLHSRPHYYGVFVALCAVLPALILMLVWLALDETFIRMIVVAGVEAHSAGAGSEDGSKLIRDILTVVAGRSFGEPAPELVAAAERYVALQGYSLGAMYLACLSLSVVTGALAFRRIAPQFRARNQVERIVSGLLIAASLVAILTTLGIVVSLLAESALFFSHVPVQEFLFGLNWEPQIPIREDQVAGAGAFGAVPVFWGTLFIALIAMCVALPIGLLSAIYMAEFASARARAVIKPVLEILAGVPTIVYGFFAVLTVAPALRRYGQMLGLDVAANSALAAGSVLGIMIIPFISSLSDDAIRAVPRTLREASLAMGATRAETMTKVLLPAALPGIVGGVLLAVSRAIGETMIVVMAAGLIARLTLNPLEGVTTVTVQIVTLLIGDTSFDDPKTLAAFGLGLMLFLSTLALNVAAITIVKRYRERYD